MARRGLLAFTAIAATFSWLCLAGIAHGGVITAATTSHKSFVSLQEHDALVKALSDSIRTREEKQLVVLRRKVSQSHCVRPQQYKSGGLSLDVSKLTRLISVGEADKGELPADESYSPLTRVVDVQAFASMETLVDALLPLGLVPAVVPEFKGITVGGSLQGLAAESSSFRLGFVHDAIVGFEVILGDGRVLWW